MLYLVGLGLGDATDITVKGLQAVRGCARVYLEAYTSLLTVGKEALVSPSLSLTTRPPQYGSQIMTDGRKRSTPYTSTARCFGDVTEV